MAGTELQVFCMESAKIHSMLTDNSYLSSGEAVEPLLFSASAEVHCDLQLSTDDLKICNNS